MPSQGYCCSLQFSRFRFGWLGACWHVVGVKEMGDGTLLCQMPGMLCGGCLQDEAADGVGRPA